MSQSKKGNSIFGDGNAEHRDAHGRYAGESREKTGFLGDVYSEHRDRDGEFVGESREKTDFLGDTYVEHRDRDGGYAGESREKSAVFGGTYIEHRDREGNYIGESREKTGLFGDTYIERRDKDGRVVDVIKGKTISKPKPRPADDDDDDDEPNSEWLSKLLGYCLLLGLIIYALLIAAVLLLIASVGAFLTLLVALPYGLSKRSEIGLRIAASFAADSSNGARPTSLTRKEASKWLPASPDVWISMIPALSLSFVYGLGSSGNFWGSVTMLAISAATIYLSIRTARMLLASLSLNRANELLAARPMEPVSPTRRGYAAIWILGLSLTLGSSFVAAQWPKNPVSLFVSSLTGMDKWGQKTISTAPPRRPVPPIRVSFPQPEPKPSGLFGPRGGSKSEKSSTYQSADGDRNQGATSGMGRTPVEADPQSIILPPIPPALLPEPAIPLTATPQSLPPAMLPSVPATVPSTPFPAAPSPLPLTSLNLPDRGYFLLDEVFQNGPFRDYNRRSRFEILKIAQDVFKVTKLYAGDIDGSMGKGTQAAIIEWQRSRGLPITGRLDTVTLDSMGLSRFDELPDTIAASPGWVNRKTIQNVKDVDVWTATVTFTGDRFQVRRDFESFLRPGAPPWSNPVLRSVRNCHSAVIYKGVLIRDGRDGSGPIIGKVTAVEFLSVTPRGFHHLNGQGQRQEQRTVGKEMHFVWRGGLLVDAMDATTVFEPISP